MIEINEVSIQMHIEDMPTPGPNAASTPQVMTAQTKQAHEALIAECVQRVLQMLKEPGDR